MRDPIIDQIESRQMKKEIPEFRVGDTVKVYTKIVEGEKERLQSITGTVIARRGSGLSETFSLYRTAYGAAMERVFPLHSPRLSKIELVKSGKVCKSKLYYLRGKFGKKSKVKEQLGSHRKNEGHVEAESTQEHTEA